MIPQPTDSVKKICPAAASHTCGLASAAKSGFQTKPRPDITFWSGPAPGGGSSVSTRTIRIAANTNSSGIAHSASRSMPRATPPSRIATLMAKVSTKKPYAGSRLEKCWFFSTPWKPARKWPTSAIEPSPK